MRIIIVLALSIISLMSYSQKKIQVKSVSEKFSVGNVDALQTQVYEADAKYVKKAWKKLIKKYSESVKMKDEIFADDVLIKRMSNNTFDIYTRAKDAKDGIVEITCAVDLGGAYLSKSLHPEKFKVFAGILKDFVVEVSKEAVRQEMDDQEKILDKLSKEQEHLVSDNKKMKEEIEDYKKKIADNEKALEQNLKDQESKKKEIEEQRAVVIKLSEKERAIQ